MRVLADFLQLLNKDADGVRTAARYVEGNNVDRWVNDVALWVDQGGILVPVGSTNRLPVEGPVTAAQGAPAQDAAAWPMRLTGASVPDGQPLPVKQVQALPAGTNLIGNVGLRGTRITTAPVSGNKTITTSPAALFAGASKLTDRGYLYFENPSSTICRIGGSGISPTVGRRVMPGDAVTILFEPVTNPDIFVCTESGSITGIAEEGK